MPMNTSNIILKRRSREFTMSTYQAYVFAIKEQVAQHLAGLDELACTIQKRPLTFNERSAVERNLQVLIEAAIGCSKHYLKKISKPVPSEARASIERIYEQLAITTPEINEMRGAIGMRNAIIHDYLNLDWKKLEAVLAKQKYYNVKDYISLLCSALLSE